MGFEPCGSHQIFPKPTKPEKLGSKHSYTMVVQVGFWSLFQEPSIRKGFPCTVPETNIAPEMAKESHLPTINFQVVSAPKTQQGQQFYAIFRHQLAPKKTQFEPRSWGFWTVKTWWTSTSITETRFFTSHSFQGIGGLVLWGGGSSCVLNEIQWANSLGGWIDPPICGIYGWKFPAELFVIWGGNDWLPW